MYNIVQDKKTFFVNLKEIIYVIVIAVFNIESQIRTVKRIVKERVRNFFLIEFSSLTKFVIIENRIAIEAYRR